MVRVELSRLDLDPRSGLSRPPPRPPELREADYDEKFDHHTVLYDVFHAADGRHVVGLAPPLAGLDGKVLAALKRAFRAHVFSRFSHKQRNRLSELWLKHCRSQASFAPGLFMQSSLRVQPNHHALFSGKKVALTKSKDNLLPWIRDWAYFYAKAHGCNAILFYDNASTAYAIEEIEETLASVPGIETAVVVAWPFKFGPQGEGPKFWDSDFSQYAVLAHARNRFLANARAVLNSDIDELVLTEDGSSVFDRVAESRTGYFAFDGRWVENAAPEEIDFEKRRHVHYSYIVREPGSFAERKWAVVPERCPPSAEWRVHKIRGMKPDLAASAGVSLRHFKAINTNWKLTRWQPELPDVSRHEIDAELVRWLGVFDAADR